MLAQLLRRRLSTAVRPKTAVVMLNMGGPSTLEGQRDGVQPFLTNLFTDPEIIPLGPLQPYLVRHAHQFFQDKNGVVNRNALRSHALAVGVGALHRQT